MNYRTIFLLLVFT